MIQRLTPVNHSNGRFGQVARYVVLHTMVGTIDSAESYFFNVNKNVSAHYGVGMSGEVRNWVKEGDTAWQAGNWTINTQSIGIEHEDKGNYNDGVRTAELYDSSARLVADICRRYGIPIARTSPGGPSGILIHKQIIATGCPDGLDVDRILRQAQEVLNGKVAATAPAAVPADFGAAKVEAINATVAVTNSVLQVRSGPGTKYAGYQANTADGLVHAGTAADPTWIHVIGRVIGEDPYGDGRNVWLQTLNALGQSHWVWAGGTSYKPQHLDANVPTPAPTVIDTIQAPPAAPAPTTNVLDPAPNPVVADTPVVADIPVVVPEPVIPPSAPTIEPVPEPQPDEPKLVLLAQVITEAVHLDAIIENVKGASIGLVPKGTNVEIAGMWTDEDGETMFVTPKMAAAHQSGNALIGINSRYFGDSNIPLQVFPKIWQSILKLLHVIH